MTIHAITLDGQSTLCIQSFARWADDKKRAAWIRTIRYYLVTCAGCNRQLTKHPMLRNRAQFVEQLNGETGNLPQSSEEAQKHWQTQEKEGKPVPTWARDLYCRASSGRAQQAGDEG